MTTSIVVPLPPSGNRYWRRSGHIMHKSPLAIAYITEVGWICRSARLDLSSKLIKIEGVVYLNHAGRDLDNCLKVLHDALNGQAWQDDNQIAELHYVKRFDYENPRVELTITELSDDESLLVVHGQKRRRQTSKS